MQNRAPKIIEPRKGNDPFQDLRLAFKNHGGEHATELGLQYLGSQDLGDQLMLLKRENLLFCLWSHVPEMVETAVDALERRIGDKLLAYKRLVVLHEQVGGSVQERIDEKSLGKSI